MIFRNDFRLRPKSKADLSLALRMYGENEPPEMQIENMWEVYSPSTGMVLADSCPDFSEFSRGERMYPDMMEPEVKARWDEKNKELELGKERYAWRKRLAHVRFLRENPDLPLAQELAQTDYGKALLEEFAPKQPRQPQSGTGKDLHDEFERDGVEFNPEEPVCVIPFAVPGSAEPFSVLATARDEDGRIVEKLYSLEPKDHHVHYEYDAGGRLCAVWKDERLIEEYKYGRQGERYFSSTPQTGQQRFTYGPGLRLVRAGEVKYSYDDQSRLVMKQDGLDVTTYEYHHSGQLEQVNLPDGKRISYVIDPQGRRIAKSVNGKVSETYSWHDFTTLAVVEFEDGGSMEFVYDAEGDPVAIRSNGEVYFLASDQVGTIYMVANEAGNEVKRIIRDSFGNIIVDTNERMNIPLGFASGLYDRDTGLVHFGHREYDPAGGRFIQPDPIGLEGGDVDVYGYCHDDPVNFVDRMGLKSFLLGDDDYFLMHGRNGSERMQELPYEGEKRRSFDGRIGKELGPADTTGFWERHNNRDDPEDHRKDKNVRLLNSSGSSGGSSGSGEGEGEGDDDKGSGGGIGISNDSGSSGESGDGEGSGGAEDGGEGSESGRMSSPLEQAPDKSDSPSPPAQSDQPSPKDAAKDGKGTFGKIADGLKDSANKISKGIDGLGGKSAAGAKEAAAKGSDAAEKAFKDGLNAAGKASKEVANQYKNNKAFRNAFNTAIAAGMAPKAAAAYAAGGGAAMANAYRNLMQRGATEVVPKIASIPGFKRLAKSGGKRFAKEAHDFVTAHDPTSIPKYSIGGTLGSMWAGRDQIQSNAEDIYNGTKEYFRK